MAIIKSNWAILLVKFKDDTTVNPPLTKYQNLFTKKGQGTLNMVEYFKNMSNGQLDVGDSEVFGWFTIDKVQADYVGILTPVGNQIDRAGLLDIARTTATSNGVNLSLFNGVVVSVLSPTDLCGFEGALAAICDINSLNPTFIAQEMGHGFGLDHSRKKGSDEDYQDFWDSMSTWGDCFVAPNPDYKAVGPGLNAWNMRGRNWLNESRVWKAGDDSINDEIELRPIHQENLSGYLCAEIDDFLIEFRTKEKWDAAIPKNCILIHSFNDNHSYLIQANNGNPDLGIGDKFTIGNANSKFTHFLEIEVLEINFDERKAKIRITKRVPKILKAGGGVLVGGVARDGGGGIIVNGVFHPIPPRSPFEQILKELSRFLELQKHTNTSREVNVIKRTLLSSVTNKINSLHKSYSITKSSVPQKIEDKQRGKGYDSKK
jgi:hypothetical protein